MQNVHLTVVKLLNHHSIKLTVKEHSTVHYAAKNAVLKLLQQQELLISLF